MTASKEHTEQYLRTYLLTERSSVVWNKVCMVSDLWIKIRQEQLFSIDVNRLLEKMVQDGVMVQIDYSTPLLGPTCAYLISGKVTTVIDNAKA